MHFYLSAITFLLLYKLTLEDAAVSAGDCYYGEVSLDHLLAAEDISHVDLISASYGVADIVCDAGKQFSGDGSKASGDAALRIHADVF